MAASLHQAVSQTLAYSRRFGLPLTLQTLHRWLISPREVSPQSLKSFAPRLSLKDRHLVQKRAQISQQKLAKAAQLARLLSFCPSIKLICATGSLAVDNARVDDDLDVMIVTSANTLWLTRPVIIIFLKLLGLRRPPSLPEHHSSRVSDKICDNLWLDETALALPPNKRNLYTAHEVLQAKPLFDRGNAYAEFILSNSWTSKYLANAYKAATSGLPKISNIKYQISNIHSPLSILNYLAFRLQYHYMKKKITHETITLHSAYFHPNDYNAKLNLNG
jgi:predicted nucleotidyltransferase